ncbi:MAG: hypothetical protein H7326_00030 [Bdellovibrionaceae bacterium]|nr:hypothetical protein [Pseudobdellovibrionaceae bacterium]
MWELDSLNVQDSQRVYFNLKSLNAKASDWIHVYTSIGYPTQGLNSEMGLVVYKCSPSQ